MKSIKYRLCNKTFFLQLITAFAIFSFVHLSAGVLTTTHTTRHIWSWFLDGTLRSTQNSSTGTATYYLWNAKKKLEGVVLSDGTSTAYAYLPGSDLRLSSVDRSGTATLFHWDGVQLREVLQPSEGSPNSPPKAQGGRAINLPTDSNPAQTITSAFITGLPGTWDEVLTVSIPDGESAESLLVFLQNHQSSVVGTTETSNPLLSKQLFTYLAYGEPKGTSPESLPLGGIGYTGRQHDDTGLMYYRGRYYDQCTGSFISEDPKRDGWNWYGYSNDPVNYNDPSGYRSDPNTNWLEESIANDSFQRNKCDPLFKHNFGLDPYLEAILNTATEVTATVVVNAALGGMVGVVARGAMAAAPKGGLTRSAGAWAKNLYRKADRTLVWQKNHPLQVINPQTIPKIHGNSLDSPKPTQGYALIDRTTGELLRYGETSMGKKRYTEKFLAEFKARIEFQAKGTKREMHKWQHEKILEFKLQHGGQRPPLNKSDY